MSAHVLNTSSLATVAVTLLVRAASCAASDAVLDRFDWRHPHAPGRAVPALSVPATDDPVAASFARMLAHEPNWTPPALPEGAGSDPLIAAMVWPLLRSKHITVAGATPAACR